MSRFDKYMSKYEKITTVVIALLIIPMIIFSYREFREPPEQNGSRPGSHFDESLGQNFKIGAFNTIVSQHFSGGPEDNCEGLQTVVIGALHDIKERLEHMKTYAGLEDAFEVSPAITQLFCNKNADVTLLDKDGNNLLLQKTPFVRKSPAGMGPEDIGTEVRIDATLIPKGMGVPSQPTTYGEVLIPDRFLDTTSR